MTAYRPASACDDIALVGIRSSPIDVTTYIDVNNLQLRESGKTVCSGSGSHLEVSQRFRPVQLTAAVQKDNTGGLKLLQTPQLQQQHETTSSLSKSNVGYRLGERNLLFERRKTASDYALALALVGITLMIVETEMSMANVYKKVGIEFNSIFIMQVKSH